MKIPTYKKFLISGIKIPGIVDFKRSFFGRKFQISIPGIEDF